LSPSSEREPSRTGFLVVAFGALLFGKFCLAAYVYHLLRGHVAFANGTCPWSD
jgi:hypothetical protein